MNENKIIELLKLDIEKMTNEELLTHLKNKKEFFSNRSPVIVDYKGNNLIHSSIFMFFLMLDEAITRNLKHEYTPSWTYKNGKIYDRYGEFCQAF